jgi:hypothetical protein
MHQLNLPRPRRRTTSAQISPLAKPSQVRHLPTPQAAPVWLRSLLTMQKSAMVLCGIVFGLSSIVYGYTVQTQGTWRSQHGQWNRLESQGRKQSVITENIKQKLAETAADEKSGLVAPKPEQIVFIPSAPQRPVKSLPPAQSQTMPAAKISAGY